jgi:hypothetical protein
VGMLHHAAITPDLRFRCRVVGPCGVPLNAISVPSSYIRGDWRGLLLLL